MTIPSRLGLSSRIDFYKYLSNINCFSSEPACAYALRMTVWCFQVSFGADKTHQNILPKIGKVRTLKQQLRCLHTIWVTHVSVAKEN